MCPLLSIRRRQFAAAHVRRPSRCLVWSLISCTPASYHFLVPLQNLQFISHWSFPVAKQRESPYKRRTPPSCPCRFYQATPSSVFLPRFSSYFPSRPSYPRKREEERTSFEKLEIIAASNSLKLLKVVIGSRRRPHSRTPPSQRSRFKTIPLWKILLLLVAVTRDRYTDFLPCFFFSPVSFHQWWTSLPLFEQLSFFACF